MSPFGPDLPLLKAPYVPTTPFWTICPLQGYLFPLAHLQSLFSYVESYRDQNVSIFWAIIPPIGPHSLMSLFPK